MSDIAARAGVSQTTVSFVLNGRSSQVKIAEETRQRVLDTAREMGYRRNELARAMVTGKTRVIGFLTYDGSSEHIWKMVAGALDEAAKFGYSVKVQRLPFYGPEEALREVIHNCSNWRLDGIISLSLMDNAFELLNVEMKSNGWQIVYLETAPNDPMAMQVATDDYSGIRDAIEHLAKLGHSRIAFMSGPLYRQFSLDRNQIFLKVMNNLFGPDHAGIVEPSHWGSIEIIERSVTGLLNTALPPTAMICPGDSAAMVAARIARNHGLKVPADLSLIGFGNFSFSAYSDPPLTSIAQPFYDVGRSAMNQLLQAIELQGTNDDSNGTANPSKILLPTSLCVRQSTAPPRK